MNDMTEWNIKETSNNCSHQEKTQNFEGYSDGLDQCAHFDNESCNCSSKNCPIIIKDRI